jgi:hypothetical protein
MNLSIIFLFSYFVFYVKGHLSIQVPPELYFTIRNNILKKIIYEDKMKAKIMINKIKFIYNRILSTYYEVNEKYYELTEADKTIIDIILSLVY